MMGVGSAGGQAKHGGIICVLHMQISSLPMRRTCYHFNLNFLGITYVIACRPGPRSCLNVST